MSAVLATAAVAGAACGEKEEPAPVAPDPALALIERVRAGSHVLVMRHATTEQTTDEGRQVVGDCGTQRNLSAQGREEARAMGAAMRELRIPVGEVRTSALCRARDTARGLGVGTVRTDDALLSPGIEGSAADDDRRARALRRLAAAVPKARSVTILVTHTGNIGAAFEESLLEGESLVFRPRPGAPPVPLGRIRLEDWERARPG